MARLIKVGATYINLDRVAWVEDRFAATREDRLVVYFGAREGQSREFVGKEADDVRTWLNSVAVNLHEATDLDIEG